ncbi:hypothetical protein X777_09791, partial [Ooceraea biroi]
IRIPLRTLFSPNFGVRKKSFENNAIVFPLFIYYDDWEINNPLGSHCTSLGGVYYYVPCLPPECVSRLENIFLALLFNTEDRNEFGNKQTFAPLIEELNFLEQVGITIIVNGNLYKIYFVLSLLLGDNLDLHVILQMFDYDPSVQNKPPCIADDFATKSKFKMTASEIKSISQESVSAFKILVEEYHNQYMKCTKQHLKPKHHNLVHYARVMMQCGPLVYLSVIRLERFHKVLKKISKVVMSRKNIAFSIVTRYQFSSCHRFMANESILSNIQIGSGNVLNISENDHFNDFVFSLSNDISYDACFVANWIDYKGTRYQPRMVLLHGMDESSCPIFAEIQFIIIHNNSPLFICSALINIGLNCNIGGFEVEQRCS